MSQAVQLITPEQMVLRYQKAVEENSADAFAGLFADDAVMEFPFVPPGWPNRFVGSDEIRAVINAHAEGSPLTSGRFHNFEWHQTTNPDRIIVEFHLPQRDPDADQWQQTGLLILEVRDNQIVLFRQYLNPAAEA
ncbi:hypothetical protein FKR81_33335 [Lentzea tibetensis]|uniref:SnoaL-like domain-containing protein n=1 Tax=Lentzea tibetensis TaxID=2591470 RepID=A0A563EJL0_9PSEU|nr:nuclear transport factor 2 family protein [Lentzea tibetensis]TWP46943.1 hypothetical protein FKR81_33335 [Lentzea tibetensis]